MTHTTTEGRPIEVAPGIDLSRFAVPIARRLEAGTGAPVHPARPIPWADRPRMTWAEELDVGAIRNAALWDAEHDPGQDGAGLTAREVGDWVRRAEADATATIFERRERTEAEGPRPTAGTGFAPTPDEEREASMLFRTGQDEPDYEAMFGPEQGPGEIHHAELIESGAGAYFVRSAR